MTDKPSEEKGFTIKDKRIASQEEPSELDKEGVAPESPKTDSAEPKIEQPPSDKEKADFYSKLPPIDFTTFIFSLQQSTLLHLGLIAHPETGKTEVILPIAKQTIDIIGMLSEKTKGNLTTEEDKLLNAILYDLRMKYIQKAS